MRLVDGFSLSWLGTILDTTGGRERKVRIPDVVPCCVRVGWGNDLQCGSTVLRTVSSSSNLTEYECGSSGYAG